MIGNVNVDLLEKTYKNAAIGITALKEVLNKPVNQELNTELQKHLRNYQEIADKSKKQLISGKIPVKELSVYTKTMMRGNIKMHMLSDISDSHIARMVIEGSTMGVTRMTKLLHISKSADAVSADIAKEFIRKEEENIENMKKYL